MQWRPEQSISEATEFIVEEKRLLHFLLYPFVLLSLSLPLSVLLFSLTLSPILLVGCGCEASSQLLAMCVFHCNFPLVQISSWHLILASCHSAGGVPMRD